MIQIVVGYHHDHSWRLAFGAFWSGRMLSKRSAFYPGEGDQLLRESGSEDIGIGFSQAEGKLSFLWRNGEWEALK